jgi:hypothetical protein
MMGLLVLLSNENLETSPLHWKAKVIDKVAEDIKTAETLALENAMDDAIHLGKMISELYSADHNAPNIPIVVNEDSKSLIESIYSTKKVKRKTMRVVISSIQQHIANKTIQDIKHVKSEDQLADVFTKQGVSSERILKAVKHGTLTI